MAKKHVRRRQRPRGRHIETEAELIHSIGWRVVRWFLQAKATAGLILAMAVVYLYSLTFSDEYFASLVFTPDSLLAGNIVPMIASWFLHANLAHLLGNIIFLYVFGRIVERKFGVLRFLLIFVGSAIISDLVAGLVFGQGGIGASGAIFGVIAAAIIMDPFYFTYALFAIPLPVLVVAWLAIFADVLGIISPVRGDPIGHFAHLSGFVGMTLLLWFFNRKDERVRTGLWINMLTLFIALFLYFYIPELGWDFLQRRF